MRLAASLVIALGLGLAVWATPRIRLRWLYAVTIATGTVMVAGAVFGWPLYPWSDLITLAFGLFAGLLLGRRFPLGLRAFFILLAVLSVVDVAQNLAFSGPPSPSPPPAGAAPNAHFIWLNFRVPLPSGHLNIGFADLVLMAAMAEHLRRNRALLLVSLVPGAVGLTVAEIAVDLHPPTGVVETSLQESLVPYLTIGWLAAVALLRVTGGERAVAQVNR